MQFTRLECCFRGFVSVIPVPASAFALDMLDVDGWPLFRVDVILRPRNIGFVRVMGRLRLSPGIDVRLAQVGRIAVAVLRPPPLPTKLRLSSR